MMRGLLAMAFVLGMFSTQTAQAQPPEFTLNGNWSLNIPQVSFIQQTPTWEIVDAGPTFQGTTYITVPQIFAYDGLLTGVKLIPTLYVSQATFTARNIPLKANVPAPPVLTVQSLFVLNGNVINGVAVQSVDNRPVSLYLVRGARLIQ